MSSRRRALRIVVLLSIAVGCCGLASCGGGGSAEQGTATKTGQPAVAPGGSAARGLFGAEVVRTCAGFGPAQAAPLLGVSSGAVETASQALSPTLRTCTFTAAGDEPRTVSFSLEHDNSVEQAASAYAAMRDNLPLAEHALKSAGVESDDSALIEISGLGDEALWTNVNGTLTVRRANLTIQVTAPRGRKQQIAVAQAVLALLR